RRPTRHSDQRRRRGARGRGRGRPAVGAPRAAARLTRRPTRRRRGSVAGDRPRTRARAGSPGCRVEGGGPRGSTRRGRPAGRARGFDSRRLGGPSCMQQLVHEEGPTLADVIRRALAVAGGTPFRVEGLRGGGRAFFIAEAHRCGPAPFLVLAPSTAEAEALAGDLALFLGDGPATAGLERRVQLFPAWDVPAFEPVSPSAPVVADRLAALFYLQQGRAPIVVTTPEAIAQRLLPKEMLAGAVRYLVRGDDVAVDELAAHLSSWGYQRVPLVEDRGEFSVRGGVIDVFPTLEPKPLRLELEGDRIERIRSFDPDTQRSEDVREEVVLLPVREISLRDLGAPEARRAVETRAVEVGMPR